MQSAADLHGNTPSLHLHRCGLQDAVTFIIVNRSDDSVKSKGGRRAKAGICGSIAVQTAHWEEELNQHMKVSQSGLRPSSSWLMESLLALAALVLCPVHDPVSRSGLRSRGQWFAFYHGNLGSLAASGAIPFVLATGRSFGAWLES